MQGKNELLNVIEIAKAMTEENPCKAKDSTLLGFAKGLSALLSGDFMRGISQDAFACFLGMSQRNLQRKQKEDGFPKPKHRGFKNVSYDPMEIINYKKNHPKKGKTEEK